MSENPTPIHVRSGYSIQRGTATPETLIARAGEMGHRRLALTDVNGVYGATVFWQVAERAGLRPLLGAELLEGGLGAVAMIATARGYENLCRIVTRIHERLDGPGGSPDRLAGDIADLGDGLELIVESPVAAERLLRGGADRRRLWLGVDPPTQTRAERLRIGDCARRFDLPRVATGRALMSADDERDAARLQAAIRTGATFATVAPAELPHPAAVLRSGGTLARQLAESPDAVANNARLAGRCEGFRLLQREPVFPDFDCPDGFSPPAYLRQLCREGIARRYGARPPAGADARLDRELRLIERKGFCEYFLVVRDIVRYARRHDAPVAGRGSGGSSLVAYLLGITNVCPLEYDIPFERFLNERREDFPDLDVDFCWRIRDDVIEYAFRRWGAGRVAMVSCHNTFQPASALRESAKAFGFSDRRISQLAAEDFADDADDAPALRRAVALGRRLVGLPHVLSVHPGGIVIGRKPIDHYVPVQRAAKGVTITQYDKDGVEDIRLVKLDLLGNRNLSTVRGACRLIRERTGRRIDVEALPPDDPAAIEALRRGETVGCNQLESPAMRHLLRAVVPRHVRDVAQALALVRPGAAGTGMKETFIRRRRGLEPVPTGHPRIDPILAGTCGVMLNEDDVMLVAAAMLDAPLAEGDRFRKDVRKCAHDDQRRALTREFLDACRASGMDVEFAKSLWVQMGKFNEYSFCRAHAASYAILAYGGVYLRTHYPGAFWTSAMNNNQSMYPLRVYVEQARRAGIRLRLPDVNRSGAEFTLEEDGAIRVGLGLVDGLGPTGVKTILDARRRRRFASLTDFLSRTGLGETETRSLILCGAFDALGPNRPTLMMELSVFRNGHGDPWGEQDVLFATGPELPEARDYPPIRKYCDERRVLGINVRGHVMSLHRAGFAGCVDADSRDLPRRVGRCVRIAGVVEARRAVRTHTGEAMMFLTFDDEFGLFEATVMPAAMRQVGRLDQYGPYIVTGRAEEQYGTVGVTVESAELHDPSTRRSAPRPGQGRCEPLARTRLRQ